MKEKKPIRSNKRDTRKPRKQFERPRPEFEQKILGIRRVTRVMAGGRRFSFSVAVVIGDKKGSVGVGTGKATDTSLAIAKAVKHARGHMINVAMTDANSIPFDVSSKYCSSEIRLMPNKGRGLVAGGAVRDVLDLAGISNVSAKIISRSKNKINNARAAIRALRKIKRMTKS